MNPPSPPPPVSVPVEPPLPPLLLLVEVEPPPPVVAVDSWLFEHEADEPEAAATSTAVKSAAGARRAGRKN